MARALPDGWETLEASGAATFEIPTLRRLAAELPDDYTVFHGVHWTRLEQGFSVFGEIDFIVLGPLGQVVLIEQKSGALEETPEGLFKRYSDKRKSVNGQIQRSIESLQSRFRQGYQGGAWCSTICCIAPSIVCGARRPQASRRSASWMPRRPTARHHSGRGSRSTAHRAQAASRSELHAFFSSELELAPSTRGRQGGEGAHRAGTRPVDLRHGRAGWNSSPSGCASSALGFRQNTACIAHSRRCGAVGLRAQYVCFNRPLADRIAAHRSGRREGVHSHGACAQPADSRFQEQAIFASARQAYVEAPLSPEDAVDVLVVDEGQDFEQAWADALFSRLALVAKDGGSKIRCRISTTGRPSHFPDG